MIYKNTRSQDMILRDGKRVPRPSFAKRRKPKIRAEPQQIVLRSRNVRIRPRPCPRRRNVGR